MKIRIKFTKLGAAKFIGHLDVMRYFQKAIRRAGIAIRLSGGFSPHPVMSFASPLGLGLTSRGEYLDIEVLPSEDLSTLKDRLSRVMAEGFEIRSCCLLPDSARNAMSIVAAADYRLTFRPGYRPEDMDAFFENLKRFYSQPQILITRQTKKGPQERDLKPLIYALRREGDSLFLQVSSGSSDNLKPETVMEAFYRFQGQELPPFALEICREELYAASGEEDGRRFLPLEELGEVI